MNWKVAYYKTNSGKVPVIDYIETQEPKCIKKIRNALRLLREFGIEESQLKARKLRGKYYKGLHELKIDSSRIIYFLFSGRKFILVHGFTKQSKKTPRQELEVARKRIMDYIGD
ncbi:MAG: type II toxin-antitoxin system RelE/ParE family toxin [Actinobacteria bacterium]|nr:type II toxin-antitoxin system RelE/ParE family toxin [Actinomycetota bacterium]